MSERIRLLRQHLGLSQTEFAKKMGMTRSMVSNLELGLIEIPDYKLEMICKAFNVRMDWLRTGEGEMFNPANRSLDALAKANNINSLTRAIVEGLITMKPEHQAAFIALIEDVAARIRNADYEQVTAEQVADMLNYKVIITDSKAQNPPAEDHEDSSEPHTV